MIDGVGVEEDEGSEVRLAEDASGVPSFDELRVDTAGEAAWLGDIDVDGADVCPNSEG